MNEVAMYPFRADNACCRYVQFLLLLLVARCQDTIDVCI